MEYLLFAGSALAARWWQRQPQEDNDEAEDNQQQQYQKRPSRRVSLVNTDNLPLLMEEGHQTDEKECWCRATYTLVMNEPPHLFYEPKEWSHTSVMLLKSEDKNENKDIYELPGGKVLLGESYQESAVRTLREDTHIDVCQPENCLHHLFTFPLPLTEEQLQEEQKQQQSVEIPLAGIWGDCYECVYRGKVDDLGLPNAVTMSLAELKDLLQEEEERFKADSRHALKLYFQRQGDLRAQRRMLKGYGQVDLEHYGLRSETCKRRGVLLLDSFHDDVRNAAMDYTMKTDDGMSPRLLYQADIVLLGVSRTGKTPLSIFISQTVGLKVANIPLVFELSPPEELTDASNPTGKPIDPRRVFCLTRNELEMEKLRQSRLGLALKKSQHKQESTYANFSYIVKDLAKARNFAKSHGFTEIDVTDRALEECASIIISKMKERFPDMHIH